MLMQIDSVLGYGYIIKKRDVPPVALTIKNSPYFYRICDRCGESEYFLGIVLYRCNSKERYKILDFNIDTYNNTREQMSFIEKQYQEIMGKTPPAVPSFVMFTQMTKVN